MRAGTKAGANWRRLLALELSAFGFFGLFWGCFAVLLADLSSALGLSPGPWESPSSWGLEPRSRRWRRSGGPPTGWGGRRT
jgi:hypothetical protein